MRQTPLRKGTLFKKQKTTFFLAALVFLAGLPLNLGAEGIVQYRFIAQTKDSQLEDVLYLTLGVELAEAGFSSTRTSDGAGYTLEIAYASRGSEADIALSLFGAGGAKKILAETAFLLTIDYSLDSQIAAAAKRLLEPAALDGGAERNSSGASAIEGLFSDAIGSEMSPDEILAATALRLDVTAAPGGSVFFGDMTDYFHYGASGAFSVGARKPWKSWSLSAGTRFTLTRVFNDSGVKGGPLYLTTAGLEFQAGTGYSRPFRLTGAASGGAAVISVSASEKTLHKTVPYADAGANLFLPVGKGFFAGVDIRYILIFDDDLLIMGIVPALSVSREFLK